MLLNLINKNIVNNALFDNDDRVLLAVSGGKDSVCMLHLFSKLNYDFAVAHCNFDLRGNESDLDQKFVEELANNYNVPFFTVKFDTLKYSKENKISIQMAARDLRYAWFNKIADEFNYSKIATAHHQDDNIETLLIKKSRKSSLGALTGIPVKIGKLVRPLLDIPLSTIEEYIETHGISFRLDKSNLESKYQRNDIRLNVLPQLELENPDVRIDLIKEIEINKKQYAILCERVSSLKKTLLVSHNGYHELNLELLKQEKSYFDILYEILKEFDVFNWKDIPFLVNAESGKYLIADRYRVVKDRTSLIIAKHNKNPLQEFLIHADTLMIKEPLKLKFSIVKRDLKKEKNTVSFDYSKLVFPLLLRKWMPGDNFKPLGMTGTKKISDFLIDMKMNVIDKENVWVLCSNEDIVWVVNHRISEKYKLVEDSEIAYLVHLN